jgi:hypothetical protein
MGVDVSTRCTGVVLVPGDFIAASGPRWDLAGTLQIKTWKVKISEPESERVDRLAWAAGEFYQTLLDWEPTHVVFEQYAPGAGSFAHSKGTAEMAGAMKVAAKNAGAVVDAAHISTVRRALLNRTVPRDGKRAKKLVREFLRDHGAPATFDCLDICDAMAVADHRLGLLGYPRLGAGPLEKVKR